MKAVVYRDYGAPDVLRCVEAERPAPKEDEVLIEVRAASVNPLDWRMLRGRPLAVRVPLGLLRPKDGRPGVDVAGRVEAVGRSVTRFRPGDEVFGACRGALAEYACAQESRLVAKPKGLTFEQAACVPVAGLTALQALRDKGRIGAGQKVLINGASGGVGTFAVQVAKSFGAEVTGVCSTRNVGLVRSLGADAAVDYTREDFTEGGARYDFMLDCVGNRAPWECARALKPGASCVIIGGPHTNWTLGLLAFLLRPLAYSVFASRKFVFYMAKVNVDDLAFLCGLMESGKVTPVVDSRYDLCDSAEAVRRLEGGHARGKVLVIPTRGDEEA